jgi:hypothetical protein
VTLADTEPGVTPKDGEMLKFEVTGFDAGEESDGGEGYIRAEELLEEPEEEKPTVSV